MAWGQGWQGGQGRQGGHGGEGLAAEVEAELASQREVIAKLHKALQAATHEASRGGTEGEAQVEGREGRR